MKSLKLNQMEKFQGGELTPEEFCGIATGVGILFVSTGVLSWIGAATLIIVVGASCGAV